MKLKKAEVEKVEEILKTLSTVNKKSVTGSDGNLDIEKFNKNPKVVDATNKLRELGIINRGILMDNGFITASMILSFKN